MKGLSFFRAAFLGLHLTMLVAASPPQAPEQTAEWSRFRGPNGSGIGTGSFPVHFGPASNVLWQANSPPGASSPCLHGDHLFLTGFESNELVTLCYGRTEGKLRWRRTIPPGKIERGAELGSPATATPVADGTMVCVYFGAYGLAAYAPDGRELWRKPLPIPVTQHGAGTSPILAGDLVVLNCDQDGGSSLVAVRKQTGETAWQVDRSAFRRGFATPLAYPPDQANQVIVPGTLRLVSYNLADGAQRWSVRGLPNEMVSSPIAADGLVFVAGWTPGSGVSRMPPFERLLEQADADHDGRLTRSEAPGGPVRQHFLYLDANKDGFVTRQEYETIARIFDESRNQLLAVRPDGRGDVTETHVAWRANRGLPYVPSPVCYEGRLYLVKNGGLASCFAAASGEVFYQEERLGALGDYYASPVAAGGNICAISRSGTAVVYRASPPLEVLGMNALQESVVATPALAGNVIYIRTASHLYAFAERGVAGPRQGFD
jgi:outer membrane protein assembly factor BamB